MTAKTPAQRKQDQRARLKAAGFVPTPQIYVHPDDLPAIKAYIAKKNKDRQ